MRGQDGRVEEPWTHLLSWAYQHHNCEKPSVKKGLEATKKIFYIQRHKKETTTIIANLPKESRRHNWLSTTF